LITAYEQLESVLPIHGSVLVNDGSAYFTAGRSSYLDGGINLYRINARTGKIVSKNKIYSPDPETGKQPAQEGPAYMPGALSDILSCDADYVYLRDSVYDKNGGVTDKTRPHLFTLTGFLDDSWPHRSYWEFATRCSISTGCSGRDRNIVSGRLLVFDNANIYGYGRSRLHWSNQFEDGPYRLFAVKRGEVKPRWEKRVPFQVRAMVLAGDTIFVAGPNEKGEAILTAVSVDDGKELASCEIESSPVFDGMAAANGELYLSLENGKLLCMAGE
jgi:outer membrane protein assembly factor BamB